MKSKAPFLENFGQETHTYFTDHADKTVAGFLRIARKHLNAIIDVDKLGEQVLGDLGYYQQVDPANAEYSEDEILTIRQTSINLAIHRALSAVLKAKKDSSKYQDIRKIAEKITRQVITYTTSLEIHPEASLGNQIAIDHGHGTVIGATAEIGDKAHLHQGVTLGGTGVYVEDTGKRHPTIGANVLIGTGASIMGPGEIGDNNQIGYGATVHNSQTGKGVRIGPGIHVSRVIVPNNIHIIGHVQGRVYEALGRGKEVREVELQPVSTYALKRYYHEQESDNSTEKDSQ